MKAEIVAVREEAAQIIGLLTASGCAGLVLDKTADFFDDMFMKLEAAQRERDELQLGFVANEEEAQEAIKYATEIKEQFVRVSSGLDTALVEIDEMQKSLDHAHRRRTIWRGRSEAAEAELKRRGAQEPVGWVTESELQSLRKGKVAAVEAPIWTKQRFDEVPLYAAAPAAVLPEPKPRWYMKHGQRIFCEKAEGWNDCIEAAKVLGCQTEKVVRLPLPEVVDIDSLSIYECYDIKKLQSSLDAAGVKWVEGGG